MARPRAVFIHDEVMEGLRYPDDCPFKTQRAGMMQSLLRRLGMLDDSLARQEPTVEAAEAELLLYHAPAYLEALKTASKGTFKPEYRLMGLGTDDTPIFSDLWSYSRRACGATLHAAKLVINGEADVVFNPSGGFHHAAAARAGGFCYLNDIVLACLLLADAGKKVLCLDLDAHHGNGTQAAFYGDARVFTASFHESGETLYPWGGFEYEIGEGAGFGCNMNVPLPAGADDDIFNRAYWELVPPVLETFAPDAIVLVLGMDVLSVDPLTHLAMTNNAVADVLPALRRTGRPIIAAGGGGYNVEATARGWALCWTVLSELEPDWQPTVGMGGVFLGSNEWGAGLRDMHLYAGREDRERIMKRVDASIRWLKDHILS